MKTIMIFLLLLCCISPVQAVEIYSAGRYFDSIEEYQKMNKESSVVPVTMLTAIPQTQPVVFVLGPDERKMQQLSYNHSVSHVVDNFEQNLKNPKSRLIVDAKELERVIEAAMKNRQEPALLIADQKKLRIMSYDAKEDKLVEAKSMEMDKTVKK